MSRNRFKLSVIYQVFALSRAMDYLKSWFNQIKISWLFVVQIVSDKINFLRGDQKQCSSSISGISQILSTKKSARRDGNEVEVYKMLRKFYQTQEPRQNKQKQKDRRA